jgi:hypothetical protein
MVPLHKLSILTSVLYMPLNGTLTQGSGFYPFLVVDVKEVCLAQAKRLNVNVQIGFVVCADSECLGKSI